MKDIVLIILLVLGVTNMAVAKQLKIDGVEFVKSYGGIEEYRLDNGLKILLKEKPDAPLISWQVWYKVGSRNEQIGLTGIAHYLEHMMFKGTDTFAKGEIAQSIELKGGVFNAFTSDDYTAYFENFAPENLELAIKLEADRMQSSRLNGDELNLERTVIISELEGRDNSPSNTVYKALKSNAFTVHPYKNPIIGWIDDLHSINDKNMREFYETYYHPNNAVAVLVGNFETEVALTLIQKYFSKYKAKKLDLPKVAVEPEQKSQKEVVIKQEGFVSLLSIGFHIPEFKHPDSAALHVLGDIAMGGVSSRFYKALVDSGLATKVSGYAEASVDPSLFRIAATLNPDSEMDKLEKVLNSELEALKSKITEEELSRAKARVEASAIYERDGAYDEALQIGYFEAISNDWTVYVDWVDSVNKVSLEDLKRVAKKYLQPNNQTTVKLLAEKPSSVLAQSDDDVGAKVEYGYGAATVEPINPAKLKRLLEITAPEYAKDYHAKLSSQKHDYNIKSFKLWDSDAAPSVLFKEDHNLPLVYINMVVYAGAVNDMGANGQGLAYLTAEMLERGTKKHDRFAISDLLDFYGANISFSVGKEYAEIDVSSLTKNLNKTLAMFDEILKEPAFDEEELKKLKAETIAKIKQEDEYPNKVAARETNRLIYPEGHPYYVYTIADRVKAIESISIKDIKSNYKKLYNSGNIVISVVGDLSEADLKQKLSSLFTEWNPVAESNKPNIPLVTVNKAQSKTFKMDNKEQSEIILAHAASVDRNHEDFYSLLLANYSLGGRALSSKLGVVVRDENGLAYSIRSAFRAALGAGAFTVSLGCNPTNVEKAISLSKDTIKKFLEEGVSQTDLDINKMYLAGSFAARNISNNEDLAEVLSGIQVFDLGLDYIENYHNIINAISLESVNKAARKHIKPESLHTVVAGP